MSSGDKLTLFSICSAVLLVITALSAMVTHIIVCIKTSAWILMLFGLFFAPVGIIHGIGIWLGIF